MIYPENYREIIIPTLWKPANIYFSNVCPEILVSNYGRIYNGKTNTFLPKNENYDKNKYINITLMTMNESRIQEMMHRIVMYVFAYFPGCEEFEVNHKDGIKYHNWLSNLEWATHKENMSHAWENNLFKFGEIRNNSKLTNQQARELCQLLEQGYTPNQISKFYKVGDMNIEKTCFNILNGHCWSHLSKEYNIQIKNL